MKAMKVMKTRIMMWALACCLSMGGAKAQFAVIDPTNLIQNILTAIETGSTASNVIKNFNEVKKVYEQGKAYYDGLKSVHNLIKNAKKVQQTVVMIGDITGIYMSGFNKMLSDPYFTYEEIEAISAGYARLLEEGGDLVDELKNIVTPSNGLSLSDKERMDAIDQIYNRMKECRALTQYYTNKNISVSYLRAKKTNDTNRIIALYGTPDERYY
jgi:hypothetical protein